MSKVGRVWLAAAALAVGCASTDAHRSEQRPGVSAPTATSITVEHYLIEIPANYEVENLQPRSDFDLYRVRHKRWWGGHCILYFGNFPSFPQLRWASHERVAARVEDRTTTAFQRPGAIEGLIEFSGLSYKDSKASSPFRFIHYLCDGLDEVEMKDLLGMVSSIKVVRPYVD